MSGESFRMECEVRESRFGSFKRCAMSLNPKVKGLEYRDVAGLPAGGEEGGAPAPAPTRLPLAGMKLKLNEVNSTASASYSKSKQSATHFRFFTVSDLQRFQRELSQWPEVFRRFEDYYDIGEKIGEGHTCKVRARDHHLSLSLSLSRARAHSHTID